MRLFSWNSTSSVGDVREILIVLLMKLAIVVMQRSFFLLLLRYYSRAWHLSHPFSTSDVKRAVNRQPAVRSANSYSRKVLPSLSSLLPSPSALLSSVFSLLSSFLSLLSSPPISSFLRATFQFLSALSFHRTSPLLTLRFSPIALVSSRPPLFASPFALLPSGHELYLLSLGKVKMLTQYPQIAKENCLWVRRWHAAGVFDIFLCEPLHIHGWNKDAQSRSWCR